MRKGSRSPPSSLRSAFRRNWLSDRAAVGLTDDCSAPPLENIEYETAVDISGSLARAVVYIQSELYKLRQLLRRLESARAASDGSEEATLVANFNASRDEATWRLGQLRIQSAALGVECHKERDVLYPIPQSQRATLPGYSSTSSGRWDH